MHSVSSLDCFTSPGLTFGLLTAVITKFTSGVRVLEPLALLGGSYLAYVTAELFHWYVFPSALATVGGLGGFSFCGCSFSFRGIA